MLLNTCVASALFRVLSGLRELVVLVVELVVSLYIYV